MPPSVKVGWRTYRIDLMDARQSASADYWGQAHHGPQVIEVCSTQGVRHAASTLLHEILHCVAKQWALPNRVDEEAIVLSFQNGLSAVWRDNPDVMAWIGRGLVGGGD